MHRLIRTKDESSCVYHPEDSKLSETDHDHRRLLSAAINGTDNVKWELKSNSEATQHY